MEDLITKKNITRKDLEFVLDAIIDGKGDYYKDKLIEKLKEITKASYIIPIISGFFALYTILKTISKENRKNIIIPAFLNRFYSKVLSDFKENIIPVDLDKNTLSLQIKEEKGFLLHPNWFGILREDSHYENITIIDDLSTSIGSYFNDKPAGSFSYIAFLNLDENSVVYGDGAGIILTQDPIIYEEMIEYVEKHNLWIKPYQSAITLSQLLKLEKYIKTRKEIFNTIVEKVKSMGYRFPKMKFEQSTYCCIPLFIQTMDQESRLLLKYTEEPIWKMLDIDVSPIEYKNTLALIKKMRYIVLKPFFKEKDIDYIIHSLALIKNSSKRKKG